MVAPWSSTTMDLVAFSLASQSAASAGWGQELDLGSPTLLQGTLPHGLPGWSFSQSFHQAVLQPTRPHSQASPPNLSCLDPTGPV